MTEAEWLACSDLRLMLDFLNGKASDRKLRLFAVACCWRVWDSLPGVESRRAVEVAERFADQPNSSTLQGELAASHAGADAETNPQAFDHENPAWWVSRPLCDTYSARECAGWAAGGAVEQAIQTDVLRDVIGNPFRPASADPAWLTSSVAALARQMYDRRDFAPMPILADALQDAGCDHPDVLAHCRAGGPHVRGCWVVDLLLGEQ
jgi:hypothetical protein